MHSERNELRNKELEEQRQTRLAEQQRERAERLREERENERKIREEQKDKFEDVKDDNIVEIVKDASDKLDVNIPTLEDALNSTEIDDDYDIPSI